MNKYIITYDLCNPNKDYTKLYARLEQFEKHERVNESVWIVQSHLSMQKVKYAILCVVDTNDKIFILDQYWNYMTLGYDNIGEHKLNFIINN